MNKTKTFVLLLLTISFHLKSQETVPFPALRSIRKIDMAPGNREIAIKMSDGNEWKMRVSIPEMDDGDTLDFILALHWGVSLNQNKEFVECLMLPSIDREKYIVLSPIANKQLWWKNPKESQLLRLIKYCKKYWPIRKIIVAGYSVSSR